MSFALLDWNITKKRIVHATILVQGWLARPTGTTHSLIIDGLDQVLVGISLTFRLLFAVACAEKNACHIVKSNQTPCFYYSSGWINIDLWV